MIESDDGLTTQPGILISISLWNIGNKETHVDCDWIYVVEE